MDKQVISAKKSSVELEHQRDIGPRPTGEREMGKKTQAH